MDSSAYVMVYNGILLEMELNSLFGLMLLRVPGLLSRWYREEFKGHC